MLPPLPLAPAPDIQVRALLGPYLVFLASTINGYEGTGRSLSLKLLQQLRQKASATTPAPASDDLGGRTLREVSLEEPIRYGIHDPIEKWLHALLCLDATANVPAVRATPHPSECELYWVDRDALFSYHSASEAFLQRVLAICVSSHYKNTPNDLQARHGRRALRAYPLLPTAPYPPADFLAPAPTPAWPCGTATRSSARSWTLSSSNLSLVGLLSPP